MCGYQQQQQQQPQQGYGYGYSYPQPSSGHYGYPPSAMQPGVGYPPANSRAPLMQPPSMGSWNQQSFNQQSFNQQSFMQPSSHSFAPMQMSGHTQQDIHNFRQQAFNNYGGHQGAFASTTVLNARHSPYGAQYPLPGTTPAPRVKEGTECAVIDNRKVCRDEECGGETKGPKKPKTAFGVDWVYGRPMLLLASTAMGGYLMVFAILPQLTGMLDENTVFALQCCTGAVTLTCVSLILYGIFANPGEMTEEEWEDCQRMASLNREEESNSSDSEGDSGPRLPLPPRAHKSWQYPRAILRYDHYCKWLANVIGLRNHRQFFVMVVLLLVIGVYSAVVDALVVYQDANAMIKKRQFEWQASWIIAGLHGAYALGVTYYVQGIFRIHYGLISRNETAKEWRSNKNYRFHESAKGPNTTWSELSEEEQDRLFGTEIYHPELNQFDKGQVNNCMAFWFSSRASGQMGDF